MTEADKLEQPAIATGPSRAPAAPRSISVVRYEEDSEWVDLHQRLPWLSASFFHDAWDLVADTIWEAAQQRRLTMMVEDYDTYIYLMVACFHHGGLCAGLYHRDEATLSLLKDSVDRVMDHGADAGPVLWSILTNLCGSPLREVAKPFTPPPLPPAVDEAVRAQILAASWLLAARKNVPLSIANCEEEVAGIVAALSRHDTAEKFLDGDSETVALVESWIDFDLDSRAIKHAIHTSARAQGIHDEAGYNEELVLWTNEAGERLISRKRRTGEAYRWPDINAGMATAFAEFGIPAADLRTPVKT